MPINEDLNDVRGTFKKCVINAELDAMERYSLGHTGGHGITKDFRIKYSTSTKLYTLSEGFAMVNGALVYLDKEMTFVDDASYVIWSILLDNSKINQASESFFINNSLKLTTSLITQYSSVTNKNAMVIGVVSTGSTATRIRFFNSRIPGKSLRVGNGVKLLDTYAATVLPNNRIILSTAFTITKAISADQIMINMNYGEGVMLGLTSEYRSRAVYAVNDSTNEVLELYSTSDDDGAGYGLRVGALYSKRNTTTNTMLRTTLLPEIGSVWTINAMWYYGRE